MKKSITLVFCLLLLSLFIIGCSQNQSTQIPDTRNMSVIIVAFDGLQAKHLAAYGYERNTAPHLEAFINKSYLYTQARSASSWTVPSFMSIFTSLYPSEHKMVNKFSGFNADTKQYVKSNLQQLAPGTVTMAQIFKENGYATAGFTGDAGISGSFGYSQGFDTYYDSETFGAFNSTVPMSLDWLSKNKDKKFFLFVHGYDVHGQHAPVQGYNYRYVDANYSGKYGGSTTEQGKLREEGLANGKVNLSAEDTKFWRAVYDEKISDADEEFASFMQGVEKMGLANNTIIIVVSDHGTEFMEHQRFDHGHTLYGELTDVLFAIHIPGQTRGKRIDSLVSTLDVMPTALSLVGLNSTIPSTAKGIDLSTTFTGKDLSQEIFTETDYRLYTHKRAVEMPDGRKLIVTMETNATELYNLTTDPTEQNNIAATHPADVAELRKKIDDHLIAMNVLGPWTIGCVPVYNDQCKPTGKTQNATVQKPITQDPAKTFR